MNSDKRDLHKAENLKLLKFSEILEQHDMKYNEKRIRSVCNFARGFLSTNKEF